MSDAAMDLVDRYLGAVGALLPAGQRPDILAELRDVLLSRLEERQAELGRPPTAEEVEGLLRAYGHPVSVAAPYRSQRPLIDPLVLPWYWLVLRVVLGIRWIVDFVRFAIGLARARRSRACAGPTGAGAGELSHHGDGDRHPHRGAAGPARSGAWLARSFGQAVATWRPRDLPRPAAAPSVPSPGWAVTWDLVGVGLVALWLSGALDPVLAPLPGILHLKAADSVLAMRGPLLAFVIAQTALHLLALLRTPPAWRAPLGLAVHLALLAGLVVLPGGWPWVEAVGLPPATAAATVQGTGVGFGITWGLVVLLTAGAVLWDLALLRRGEPWPPAGARGLAH